MVFITIVCQDTQWLPQPTHGRAMIAFVKVETEAVLHSPATDNTVVFTANITFPTVSRLPGITASAPLKKAATG